MAPGSGPIRGPSSFPKSTCPKGRVTVTDTTYVKPDEAADPGAMSRVPMRVYEFPPHKRRAKGPDESDEDYHRDIVAKGHPALTQVDAFPGVCPAS